MSTTTGVAPTLTPGFAPTLTNVFTKCLRDRWTSTAVATSILALMLAMGMAVYSEIDLSLYDDVPEAFRALIGIPTGADAATLSYNVMFGTFAALTLAGLAVSMGAAAIAGEERDGTLGLLLGNPRSRSRVLASKAGAMATLVVFAGVVLWAAGMFVPRLVGVEIGQTHVAAMTFHLGVNALFHGAVALAIGGWTGNRRLASTLSASMLAASFVAIGLLPLVEATADLVRVIPWHYYDRGRPMVNGVDWGDMGLLLAGTAVLTAVAFVGLRRRDLRGRTTPTSLMDRLRANPRTQKAVERLAGSTRVSRIAVKRASDHQGTLLVVAALMFGYMGLMIGVFYQAIADTIAEVASSLPQDILVFAGGVGDFATPEGFYWGETFGMMAPIATILVAVLVATRGITGEEANRTMGLLLANPVSRARVMAEVTATMVGFAAVVGAATFLGVTGGNLLGGMGIDIGHIAAATTLQTLVGLVFGGLALAIAGATGWSSLAVWGTVSIAVVAHIANAFLSLSDRLAGWARLSPFHWYSSSEPLVNGMPWAHAAVLAAAAAALIAIAFWRFEARDLRHG